MKKFILLTLTLIALAFNAQAGTNSPVNWFSPRIGLGIKTVDGTPLPTGVGKVYGSSDSADDAANSADGTKRTENKAEAHRNGESNTKYSQTFYMYAYANPEKKWRFVEWQDANGNSVKNQDLEKHTAQVTISSNNMCSNQQFTSSQGASCSAQHSDEVNNHYDAWYYAIFEPTEKEPAVKVDGIAEGNTTCSGYCTLIENDLGDEVTIYASCGNVGTDGYQTKFLGWRHNGGEIFSTESSLTFIIDENNAGTYTPVFDSGYKYGRFKNVKTGHYISIIKDESPDNMTVQKIPGTIELQEKEKAICDPGTIIKITKKKPVSRYWVIFNTQNTSTEKFYEPHDAEDKDKNAFLMMDNVQLYNAWHITGNNTAIKLEEEEDGSLGLNMISNDEFLESTIWKFEPLDKDLTEEPECWFTVDPANCVEANDGSFFTTMRTEFNYKYDRDKVTAYVVSGRNDEDGTLQLTEINSNIIPGKTCVLLKLTTTEAADNVFIPTESGSSFDPSSVTNLLVSTPKDGSYFANQSTSESNMKALCILANGEIGFGGNALTTIDGNRCYLQIPKDYIIDIPAKQVILGDIVGSSKDDKKYGVLDLICVKAVPNLDDGSAILYCKDDNGYVDKDKNENGYNDYILNVFSGDGYRDSHDQSNWIALYAPKALFPANAQNAPSMKDGQPVANSAMLGLQEQKINNVVGVMTDLKNPALTLKSLPVANAENKYTLNTYVPANFKGTQNGYFFISPKPMEIAQIRWAVWTGDHFVNIPKTAISNTADLEGSFDVDFSLMESDIRPVENGIYDFVGLIKIKDEAQLQAADEMDAARRYVVYPFNLNHTFDIVEGFPTGIKDVDIKDVKNVKYYNLMGHGSDAPHKGVNIIVTTMKDGTTKTSKRVF